MKNKTSSNGADCCLGSVQQGWQNAWIGSQEILQGDPAAVVQGGSAKSFKYLSGCHHRTFVSSDLGLLFVQTRVGPSSKS